MSVKKRIFLYHGYLNFSCFKFLLSTSLLLSIFIILIIVINNTFFAAIVVTIIDFSIFKAIDFILFYFSFYD